jgi:glycosyltransferase involved in cell wall biosynthesis
MCDHWARVDDRIKTLHKPNGGLSDARNYGLRHAMGEYIVFIDSDDFWCHDDDLQKLMAVAEKADFVRRTLRWTSWVIIVSIIMRTRTHTFCG